MQLTCPACGTRNRVPDDRVGDEPTCGRCQTELLPLAPIALNDANLDRYLTGTDQPVLIDFWAEWCGPCRMMAPQFANAASQMPEVRFVKVDSDAATQAASRFGIRSIPTIVLTRGGNEVARHSGVLPAAQLQAWVRSKL